MFSGNMHTSKSMLPPPSRPAYNVTFPSNLLAYPLKTANPFPNPNSFPYMSNLGELPICILFPSKNTPILYTNGLFTHESIYSLISLSPWLTTNSCNRHAVHPMLCSSSSPAVAVTLIA
ncbi:hypothetical protein HanIR_Chr02g0062781 [Helianthus annuus]|nr:hypothetical protein HanIR_Chr02g0062781 [Helianthus annuus]